MFRIVIKGKVGAVNKFIGDKVDIGDTVNIDGVSYTVYKKGLFKGQTTLYLQ